MPRAHPFSIVSRQHCSAIFINCVAPFLFFDPNPNSNPNPNPTRHSHHTHTYTHSLTLVHIPSWLLRSITCPSHHRRITTMRHSSLPPSLPPICIRLSDSFVLPSLLRKAKAFLALSVAPRPDLCSRAFISSIRPVHPSRPCAPRSRRSMSPHRPSIRRRHAHSAPARPRASLPPSISLAQPQSPIPCAAKC